mgnify:CR=1 FL=1
MKGFKRTVSGTQSNVVNFTDYVVENAHLNNYGIQIRFVDEETNDAIHITLTEDDMLRIKHVLPKSTREMNLEQEVYALRQALEDAQVEKQRYEEALDGRRSVNG